MARSKVDSASRGLDRVLSKPKPKPNKLINTSQPGADKLGSSTNHFTPVWKIDDGGFGFDSVAGITHSPPGVIVNLSLPDIAWGKRSMIILDVGY
ncbi:hypothetical protein LguiB_010615 [Lonicera macranthoides]